jgi:hypothetical protein
MDKTHEVIVSDPEAWRARAKVKQRASRGNWRVLRQLSMNLCPI